MYNYKIRRLKMEQVRKQSIFSRIKNSLKEFIASDEELTTGDSFNISEFSDEDAKILKMLQEQSSKIDEKAKTMFEGKAEERKGLKKSINAKVSKVDAKAKTKSSKAIEDREIDD